MPTILTAPPAPPTPSMTAAAFDAAAYALASWHSTNVSEMNLLSAEVETNADTAAAAAAIKNLGTYRGLWLVGTTYATGDSVKHGSSYWLANAPSTGVTPVEGASWSAVAGASVAADPAATEQTTTLLTLPVAAGASNASTFGVVLDATRTLLLITDSAALHAVVHDSTADTYGTVVLVRTATMAVINKAQAALVATDKVLCISVNSTTGFEAVVLTVSGTTVTVGTAATATLASSATGSMFGPLVTMGASYVIPYGRVGASGLRAVTVSGTTATIGSELALSGNSGYQAAVGIDSTKLLAHSFAAATAYWQPVTVSGTTLTAGTQATAVCDANAQYFPKLTAFATGGRFASLYTNTATYGAVVTVSGTTATVSTVSLTSTGAQTTLASLVTGNQLLMVSSQQANVLTDSSGTAVAGTAVSASASSGAAYYGSNYLWVHSAGNNHIIKVGLSGNNPVVQDVRALPSVTPAVVFGNQDGTFSAPGWYLQGASTATTLNMQSPVTFAVTSAGVVTQSTYTGLRSASTAQWFKASAGAAWVVLPVVGSTTCRLSKVVME